MDHKLEEALDQAVKYAKADAVLTKLEKEAGEVLNSVDPPFYFAHSRCHVLEEGLSISVRVDKNGCEYKLNSSLEDTKDLTIAEAVYLIMYCQEQDEKDV